jgi:hypothetical protein
VIAERPLVARKASAQFITDRAQTGGIMRRAPIIAAIALITLAHPVQAQTTSPESMAAAKELVITMRAADQFNAVFPMLMQQLRPVMLQGRPEIEKDYDTLIPQVITAAKTRIGELVDAIAIVYAQHFNADELKQIGEFYKRPVGQKFLAQMPTITRDSLAVGQKFGQSLAADLRDRMTNELRKKGHNI